MNFMRKPTNGITPRPGTTQPTKIQGKNGQKYDFGRFKLSFLGLGWHWVVKFVGFILRSIPVIFTCFVTQHNLVKSQTTQSNNSTVGVALTLQTVFVGKPSYLQELHTPPQNLTYEKMCRRSLTPDERSNLTGLQGSRTVGANEKHKSCLLYTSPSPRDRQKSRMPSSA